jgi:hypothetical protein
MKGQRGWSFTKDSTSSREIFDSNHYLFIGKSKLKYRKIQRGTEKPPF